MISQLSERTYMYIIDNTPIYTCSHSRLRE